MTNEDKELLLKDIIARLPYGVFCDMGLDYPLPLQSLFVDRLDGILLDFYEDGKDYQVYLGEVKPYLFPLSSMTEEQKVIYGDLCYHVLCNRKGLISSDVMEYVNWCYKNHIDINNLIPKGLANDATGLDIY